MLQAIMADPRQRNIFIIGLVLLVLAVFLMLRSCGDEQVTTSSGPSKTFYYDLDQERFFLGDTHVLPPIESPYGGNDGVRATIYACRDAPKTNDVIVNKTPEEIRKAGLVLVYVEMFTEAAKEAMKKADIPLEEVTDEMQEQMARYMKAIHEGHLIMGPRDTQWRQFGAYEGALIQAAKRACGPGAKPIRIEPVPEPSN